MRVRSKTLPFTLVKSCTIQCGEFTIEMENGLVFLISPDGISVHPDKDNLKDCLEGRDSMRNYFYFKKHALTTFNELIPYMDAFPNTKKQIELYSEDWK